MRSAVVVTAALVVFLASDRVANAAATARVDVFPSQPRVGQTVTIQLRPFWTLVDGTLPPALFPEDYPWRVAAMSPSGRQLRIRIVRRPDNAYLWNGVARFRSRGLWTVCVLNFSSTGRACIPRTPGWQRVQVRRRNAPIDVWQRLERPFHIPTIAAGTPCPTTAPATEESLSRIGFVGTWGEGPAFPLLDGRDTKPTLRYQSIVFGSGWLGEKVLWLFDPDYAGPLLIRGLQLDGPNEVRFDQGIVPPREMRIPQTVPPGFRPSFTRVRASGCYAYQVDGLGFSYVIIFEARPS